MEEYNVPVVFPLSIDTQSESGLRGGNCNFFEEGLKESEMMAGPVVTEMAANSIFEGQPMATDMATNNNLFDEEHGARDIVVSSTIIEEGPRICPLCGSVVKLFFMNFNEQLLMCENVECDFPFGHEDLQIVHVDTGVEFNEEVSTFNSTSIKSKIPQSSPTCSIISAGAWSEISKTNRDSESIQFDNKTTVTSTSEREEKLKKQIEAKKKQDKTLQNLNDIKHINAALKDCKYRPKTIIRNEKWLHNMKSLEEMSGVKLLTKKEKEKLKGKQSQMSEFKIDIDTTNDDNNISSINIQITNTGLT